MGNIWLLIAAPATVLAAVLFWRVFDIQHADYETTKAEIKAEKSQFDADFAEAFRGKKDEKLEAKAKADAEKLVVIEKEKEEARKKAKAEAEAQIKELDKLLSGSSK